jgi:hypothetical protein
MAKKSVKSHELSALRIPGFNAEASLYTAGKRYRGAHLSTLAIDSGKVLPQLFCAEDPETGGTWCCGYDGFSMSCRAVGPHYRM